MSELSRLRHFATLTATAAKKPFRPRLPKYGRIYGSPLCETAEVRAVVTKLREHYFPRELFAAGKKKARQVDLGLPLSKALQSILEWQRNSDKAANDNNKLSIELWAKCRLEGENANGLRGFITLNRPLNQNISVLVFCAESMREKALAAGAKYVANAEMMPSIIDGSLQFDRCIASPDQMPTLAKLARVLGPKGLMPTVKTGTLSPNIEEVIRKSLSNTPFKIDKENSIFQLPFGTADFGEKDLRANYQVAMDYLQSQNKTTEGGKFVEEAVLKVGEHRVALEKAEFGQDSGPKFLVALERHRAQVAARKKSLEKK